MSATTPTATPHRDSLSAARYTSGPWHAKRGVTQMCDPESTTVAIVGPTDIQGAVWWVFSPANDHGDAEATARLIAAAPALLAELHHQYMALGDLLISAGHAFAVRAHVEREQKRLHTAIAAATVQS